MRQHATVLSICVDGMMRIESQYVELREHGGELLLKQVITTYQVNSICCVSRISNVRVVDTSKVGPIDEGSTNAKMWSRYSHLPILPS